MNRRKFPENVTVAWTSRWNIQGVPYGSVLFLLLPGRVGFGRLASRSLLDLAGRSLFSRRYYHCCGCAGSERYTNGERKEQEGFSGT